MAKQGEVVKITTKDESEFKEAPVVKKTAIITIQNGKPTRIYFEDGKQVKAEPI